MFFGVVYSSHSSREETEVVHIIVYYEINTLQIEASHVFYKITQPSEWYIII